MLKKSLFYIFILANFNSYGQLKNADEFYPNGKAKYKGKFISCVVDFIDGVYFYEKRKSGKWIYYYPSGGIKRIEYHTKSKSCKTAFYKEGKWQYFNEEGVIYLEEKYAQDTLRHKEIAIYTKDQLVAKISIQGENYDTVFYNRPSSSCNLVPNPGFESYYYKPVKIVNDGQDKIQDIIPYWNSPDDATPDYYNNYRFIRGVPNNLKKGLRPMNGESYLGLMLFFHPNQRFEHWEPQSSSTYDNSFVYSESIQAKLLEKLVQGKIYCFKTQIILSQNSGLSIDRFGVYFSENETKFKRDQFPEIPQISFHELLNRTNEWTTLCKIYIANGNAQYLTLGRFNTPEDTNILLNSPVISSELDINKSAYYLLDNVELYEVSSKEECNCRNNADLSDENEYLTEHNLSDFFKINDKNKVVLKNVNFDFDKTEFKKSSLPELQNLNMFLASNPKVKILITGHTDDSGSVSYNMQLSLQRALAIKAWLTENGIESSRISCVGKGLDIPIENNLDEHNKSKNRRVEFEIIDE